MKNKMDDLRNHLFAALEGLADEEKPMDIDRARAVAEVAGRVIDSAKVEVDFAKVTGLTPASDFFRGIAAEHGPALGNGADRKALRQ